MITRFGKAFSKIKQHYPKKHSIKHKDESKRKSNSSKSYLHILYD